MEAIIFDIDGTLWDSTDEVAVSWNQAIREQTKLERTLTGSELKKEFGKPLDEIMEDLFPELSRQERDDLSVHMYRYENRWVESAPCIVYDKVPETIRALSMKYRLFIVSNCQSGYIELFLEKTGLASCITDFECPGNTGLGKGPNIRLVMERNGLKAPVYVGDIESDRQAAAEAGIPFCHASYGFGSVEAPDYAVSSFPDLLTLFPRQI